MIMPPNNNTTEADMATQPQLSTATKAGMRLALAPEGEEVCISGLSGLYPESDNVYQFRDNLLSKKDMVVADHGRWMMVHPDLPTRMGRINGLEKFDGSFFGYHYKQSESTEGMCRFLMEKTYEAIVDAGVNPEELRGSRTGVFVGSCSIFDYGKPEEAAWQTSYNKVTSGRTTYANRISYWLQCHGPSFIVDTACSSSSYAVDQAYAAIRDGHCDQAIVAGNNLCTSPLLTIQFYRLGVLSKDAACKSFDKSGNGYVRSEAVSVIFLQKAKHAKRVYATIVHSKTNCDGYKGEGITYPSGNMQKKLFREFYEECQIDPTSLAWIEAHGTGTVVGDPEECNAISEVFCEGRKTPLLIGSVKSNIGHTEATSGLCSITKAIIAMETGLIPPNLHYTEPREGIPALADGSLKVITEPLPWDGGLVGVNSFGFGGANCHMLLRSNQKTKVNGGVPADKIPRLVTISSRTELGVDQILDDLESRPVDAEYIRLYHALHAKEIPAHIYRGYTILTKPHSIRHVQYYSKTTRPVWFILPGSHSQWSAIARSLRLIPAFSSAIDMCHQALLPTGLDLHKIISEDDTRTLVNNSVGTTAVQIGMIDILTTIGVRPDGMIGHSIGELAVGYADKCMTLEQTILSSYHIALTLDGLIGGDSKEVPNSSSQYASSTSRDTPHNCVICESLRTTSEMALSLKEKDFQKEVDCCINSAIHSQLIANAESQLKRKLMEIIPSSETCSATSKTHCDDERRLASAEYFSNTALHPVLLEDTIHRVPNKAIMIRVSPDGRIRDALSDIGRHTCCVPLTDVEQDGVEFLLTAFGRLYECGLDLELANMYPEVQFPVSRCTPMISPVIGWDHSESWYFYDENSITRSNSAEHFLKIKMSSKIDNYFSGHVIDGRNLCPATGYLCMVWETLEMMHGRLPNTSDVVFEGIRFNRATILPQEGEVDFVIIIQKVTGNFEVVEGDTTIVTGRIYFPDNVNKEMAQTFPVPKPSGLKDLSSKDIYKELHLRGYNYSGLFKSLLSADNMGVSGKIRWVDNWVAFMDNMLQMQIIGEDTRGLFVPTSIDKIVINTNHHLGLVKESGKSCVMDIAVYRELGIIKAGGIEVRGLNASAIPKRKQTSDPVLEKYQFLPNCIEVPMKTMPLDLLTALRVCVHVTLENQYAFDVSCVEVADEAADPQKPLLASSVLAVLGDLPLVRPVVRVLSKDGNPLTRDLEATILIENETLDTQQNCLLVIGTNLLTRQGLLQSAIKCIGNVGCIISREPTGQETSHVTGLQVLNEYSVGDEKIVLLKKGEEFGEIVVIKMEENSYSWLTKLQTAMAKIHGKTSERILLVAQGQPMSGILGLFNCIRRESGGNSTRCFFILDNDAPEFDPELPFYKDQIAKDVAHNVFKDGCWGSYRHLALEDTSLVEANHTHANIMTIGDLTSFRWFRGPLDQQRSIHVPPMYDLVNVYYSALNFRDIMTATGKLAVEVVYKGRLNQECIQGLEFSGRDAKGQRVMGMMYSGSLASTVIADSNLLTKVPDHWSLEEAATVPVVYCTTYVALFTSGRMKRGDTVLIHAGSGGVGQAAINLALHEGCQVFTTVGTQEKRDFIKQQFPQIPESHIGNSRDTSFEQMIMKQTQGRGVDIVLNSLSEEKLQASLRCLAIGGRFLEIGKFDMAANSDIGMDIFLKETSFHGIILDSFFDPSFSSTVKRDMMAMLNKGIADGAVKPLPRTSFKHDEVEQAFRYMGAGKHIGKVLVQIRPEEDQKILIPEPLVTKVIPRIFCDSKKSYIIAGGLGGFGLELADWLVLRGARKLVLSSRTGVTTGYQVSRIRTWQSYGATIVIDTADISTTTGVTALVKKASELGSVAAIFNLAVALSDALFENQTEESFISSAASKSEATKHFDVISRRLCPELQHFVVFSSVSCGRGNTGQTNYGMSNSVMERICEKRVMDGLPGLAVQWGAVGDVGLVADMMEEKQEIIIGGTLQQRISSCLFELDRFMCQSHPVVASMVVAEKRSGEGSERLVDCVMHIMGLHDLKTVSLQSPLAELGMDSIMAVEIKQSIERDYELFLSPQELRSITFAMLMEISQSKESGLTSDSSNTNDIHEEAFQFMILAVGDEKSASLPTILLPSLVDSSSTHNRSPIYMIPGLEGMASVLGPVARNLHCRAIGLQFGHTDELLNTTLDMAKSLLSEVKMGLSLNIPFNLLGYSFGGLIALDLAILLEAEGYRGHVFLLDSSPEYVKGVFHSMVVDGKDDNLDTNIILNMLNLMKKQKSSVIDLVRSELNQLANWDERVDYLLKLVPETKHSQAFLRATANMVHMRLQAILKHTWSHAAKVQSDVTLIRPTHKSMKTEEDYGLSKICEKTVNVHFVEGNHVSILDSPELADIINSRLATIQPREKRNTNENIVTATRIVELSDNKYDMYSR